MPHDLDLPDLTRSFRAISDAELKEADEESHDRWRMHSPFMRGKPIEHFDAASALVIVASGGMGKSHLCRTLCARTTPGVTRKLIQLGDFADDASLRQEIQRAKSEAGNNLLELYLDGLDEIRMQFATAWSSLCRTLRLERDRLKVRITCRPSTLPFHVKQQLGAIWPPRSSSSSLMPDVDVIELQPLAIWDIRRAARCAGVDPNAFTSALRDRDLYLLASFPLTLRHLIRMFRRDGTLPPTEKQLWSSLIERLCETSAERHDRGLATLTSSRARHIGGWMAACVLLGRRGGVCLGPGDDLPSSSMMTIDELVTMSDVSAREIEAVAGLGLFVPNGPNRIRFAHRPIAERMAADWLSEADISGKRLLPLLTVFDAGRRVVPPAGADLAGICAAKDGTLRAWLLDAAPALLLAAEIAPGDDDFRRRLVDRILSRVEADEWAGEDGIRDRAALRRVLHPRLAQQLEPVVTDDNRSEAMRRAAFEIAVACGVSGLTEVAIALALDSNQPDEIRFDALRLAEVAADAAQRARVRPLLQGESDDFLGQTLRTLWPHAMDTTELLESLRPPGPGDVYTVYSSFLHDWQTVFAIPPQDLPQAIEWAKAISRTDDRHHGRRPLADNILTVAVRHASLPSVAASLADALWERALKHEDLFNSSETDDDATAYWNGIEVLPDPLRRWPQERLKLLEQMVERRPDNCDMIYLLSPVGHAYPLIAEDDLDWVVDRACTCPPAARERWIELANFMILYFTPQIPSGDYIDRCLSWMRRSDRPPSLLGVLEAHPPWWTDAGSNSLRERQRAHAQRVEEMAQMRREWAQTRPTMEEVVAAALDAGRTDTWNQWCEVSAAFASYENWTDERSAVHHVRPIASTPAWSSAEPSRIEAVLSLAKAALGSCQAACVPPRPPQESSTAAHGMRALQLVFDAAPNWLASQSDAWWRGWAPLCAFGYLERRSLEASEESLVAMAYARGKAPILETIAACCQNPDGLSHAWTATCRLGRVSDAALAGVVIPAANSARGNEQRWSDMHAIFARRGVPLAFESASQVFNDGAASVDRRCRAAIILLGSGDSAREESVLTRVDDDRTWGRRVVEILATHEFGFGAELSAQASPTACARLFVFAQQQDPPIPRSERDRFDPSHHISRLRSTLLQRLTSVESAEAHEALEWVCERHANPEWAAHYRRSLRDRRANLAWRGITPKDLASLAESARARYVPSASDLMELVIESMGRLENVLQGDNPLRELLWDQRADGSWRPKNEALLSDLIKHHLDQDIGGRAVVVNREVEIRRPTPGTHWIGQRTDVLVTAVSDLSAFRLVIEVKRCGNTNLLAEIETKLVGQYLGEHQSQHGLYLVGCFCPEDPQGCRRSGARNSCEAELSARAADLCSRADVDVRALTLNCSLMG